MKYSIKEMVDYGYTYCGVIPVDEREARFNFFNLNKPVLILRPDNAEYYADCESDFKFKDEVIYGLERSETEIKILEEALDGLRGLKDYLYYDNNGEENPNRPRDLMDCGIIDGEWGVWMQVVKIFGFTDADIEAVIGEYDTEYCDW